MVESHAPMKSNMPSAAPTPAPAGHHRKLGLAVAAALFIADQLLKYIVLVPMGMKELGATHYFLPFFQFTMTHNSGVALGMFGATTDTARWILTGITAAIALFVATWMWREKARGDVIGLALVLGGALGNIVDRVRFGYVVDFLDLHFGSFRPFLIFNLADAAITVGVVILLLRAFLIKEEPAPQTEKLETEDA